MHVESISFNWHLFRNTNLTYHDEMWKKMYLASEIIFEFILAYFILLFGHFWPKHLFDFKKNYFYVYINDTASKSLKQARKIVLLSHLKGWLNWILPGYKTLICLIPRIPCNSCAQSFKILITLQLFWTD